MSPAGIISQCPLSIVFLVGPLVFFYLEVGSLIESYEDNNCWTTDRSRVEQIRFATSVACNFFARYTCERCGNFSPLEMF